jgi:hypothetical protein
VQGKDIVARIRYAVTVVALLSALMTQQIVSQQTRDDLVHSAVSEIRNRRDQGQRYQGMVLHSLLDGLHDSKVLGVHRPQHCGI